MKHTPGPWITRNSNMFRGQIIEGNERHVAVALYDTDFGISEQSKEVEANAKLIAAAPELLEAAKIVLKGLNVRIDDAVSKGIPIPIFNGIASLSDAINKAIGEADENKRT